jgi:hypothetical protein
LAAVVWEDIQNRYQAYVKAAKDYKLRGGIEKMRHIMMCFDENLKQSEKVWRAVT